MNNLPIVTESILPIPETEVDFFNFQQVQNHNFAIVFDNFLRDNLMWKLIKSIQLYYPTVKMYIAEQGVYNPIKDILYQKLQTVGHEIIYTGFDAGLGICRNRIVKEVKEPFIFYCDSDNLFTEETKIEKLIEILQNYPKIGFIGILELKDNKVWHYENYLSIENNKVIYKNAFTPENEYNNEDFFICDMTMNVGLVRKELFNKILWDERMKVSEHADFFLQIKYFSNYKVACSKIIKIVNQNVILDNPLYNAYRQRNKTYWMLYKDKWNVTSIDGWQIPLNNIHPKNEEIKKTEPNKIIEQKIELTPLKVKIHYQKQLIDYLLLNKISFWLLNDSCLQIIKYSDLEKLSDLYIGVYSNQTKEDILKLCKNIKFKLNIAVEPNRKTKTYQVQEKNILVPIPVVKYLEKLYNETFDKLMEKK